MGARDRAPMAEFDAFDAKAGLLESALDDSRIETDRGKRRRDIAIPATGFRAANEPRTRIRSLCVFLRQAAISLAGRWVTTEIMAAKSKLPSENGSTTSSPRRDPFGL